MDPANGCTALRHSAACEGWPLPPKGCRACQISSSNLPKVRLRRAPRIPPRATDRSQEGSKNHTFSILFCDFLKIQSLEFDDIKNSQRKSTKLSESTLTCGFGLILLECEKEEGLTFRDHFLRNFHEKMKFPKFIQDHSGMVPGAS